MKTMKKVMLAVLMVVFSATVVFADGNDPKKETKKITKISGQVIDQITGETLAGVKILVPGTDKVAYSDFDGVFQIECEQGCELNVSMISYEGKSVNTNQADKITLSRQK